jgi:hypothetical protein
VLLRVPAIAERPSRDADRLNPHELRIRAFAVLQELLGRLAERRPLILFLDGFQWADADSIMLLGDLTAGHDAPSMLVVVTCRHDEADRSPALRALDASSGTLRTIRLDALSPHDAARLAAILLECGADDPLAAAVARESAGSPFFVGELARYARANPERAAAGELHLENVLAERLGRLPEPARRLLEVLAVAGRPVTRDVAFRAAGSPATEGIRIAGLLRAEGLARTSGSRGESRIEASHDRVAEAVRAGITADEERRLHRSLAAALEAAGAAHREPDALVRHLEAAGETARAAELATRAAGLAAASAAFDNAAELYRTALRLDARSGEERRRLLLLLAEALTNAGRGAEAADLYLEAAVGADEATRIDSQRRAAEQLIVTGHVERGLAIVSEVLLEIGERLPSTPLRALLSLLWTRARLFVRGFGWKSRDKSELVPRDVIRVDIYRTLSHALGMLDAIRGAAFQTRGLLLALRLGERRRIGELLAFEALYLCAQGGRALPRARALVHEAASIGRRARSRRVAAYATLAQGFYDYFSSRFPAARSRFAEAERLLRERAHGTAWIVSMTGIWEVFALRQLGALRDLRRRFDEHLRDAVRRGDRYTEAALVRACSVTWLAAGDPAAARRDLDRPTWSPPDAGYHTLHFWELWSRVELELYEGRAAQVLPDLKARFSALQRSLMPRLQFVRIESLWLRGRVLLACAAAGRDAMRTLRGAARLARRLEAEGLDVARLWASLLRAGIASQRRDEGRATAEIEQAILLADSSGMALAAAAARRRLGQLAGGAKGAGLIATADQWMRAEGIADPERMTSMAAPGFLVEGREADANVAPEESSTFGQLRTPS